MTIARLSTSGQICLPKHFRDRFDTMVYVVSIHGDSCTFKPLEMKPLSQSPESKNVFARFPKKSGRGKGLKAGQFRSRTPRVKNLADQIDDIIAGSV